jgi:diaminohydroxyphosphoribosylaminopyrimidine deaminase/5-amino-6-(5-phosphoribosylamino)uracil reductase
MGDSAVARYPPPDPRFMEEALRLARAGLEGVSPNPMVGAVLVRGGEVLARGFHRLFGGPHAEVDALRQARDGRGADLYVTLEPCGHHGKTPPCAEAIAAAGVRRVVYAAADLNPLTRGRGLALLRRAGVELHRGLLGREALALNAPYFHWMRSGRPWVILKWAMSLDGKIATRTGESRWITGRQARAHGHALRRRADAVMVGTLTALRDDPRLTPRPARGRRPMRIILDRRGRLPLDLRILAPERRRGAGLRVYVTSRRTAARRGRELESRGVRLLVAPEGPGGLDLAAVLSELGRLGVSQLLVEGGGKLGGSFLEGGLVDEVAVLLAPLLIGGAEAPGPLEGSGIARLSAALRLEAAERRLVGEDLLIQGLVRRR